jgi:pantetheine-phosphate adenylyltransferase
MSKTDPKTAIFPGTFDPITNGHVDVIRRGAGLFDRLVVAVGENPAKSSLLCQSHRVEILREVLNGMANVRVEAFSGLTIDFARRIGATAILRGLRNSSDLQTEFQLATTNRVVAGLETVFILTASEHAFTSSSLIKQLAQMGGDVSALVPPEVLRHLKAMRPDPQDGHLEENP